MARGWLSVLPGVRASRQQVEQFAAEWETHNERELAELGPDDDVYVALGDSLTQGIGASSLDATWVHILTEQLRRGGRPVRLLNLSKSGGKIGDVLDDQLPRIADLGRIPTVVTCTVGSNDLIGSVRFNATVHKMGTLLSEIPDHSVVATLPDRGSVVARSFNKRLRTAAAEACIELAEVAPLAFRGRRTFASDWFHPSDFGYQAWLQAFADALGVDGV